MFKCIAIVASLLVASVVGDGIGGHSHDHSAPARGSRQLDTGYIAGNAAAPPIGSYGAASSNVDTLSSYGNGGNGGSAGFRNNNDLSFQASELDAVSTDPLDMLMKAVPGIPGEDYPIYAEAPETSFVCDGQINGGYYADPEAECQVFHICSADGAGGLSKYSFLCPNGTIFNQEYFICDWWFNFDCSEAQALAESKNAELEAARAEADAALAATRDLGAAGSSNVPVQAAYGSPTGAASANSPVQASYGSPDVLDTRSSGSLPSYGK